MEVCDTGRACDAGTGTFAGDKGRRGGSEMVCIPLGRATFSVGSSSSVKSMTLLDASLEAEDALAGFEK